MANKKNSKPANVETQLTSEPQEFPELKLFAIRSVYFILWLALILLIICAYPLAISLSTGELTSIDAALAKQHAGEAKNETILFGPAYGNPVFYYKQLAISQQKPQLLAIGTSRVLAMRKEFFNSSLSFYNAGNAVTTLADIEPFLRNITPSALPQILFISLDQNFFDEKWTAETQSPVYFKPSAWSTILRFRDSVPKIYIDTFIDKRIDPHAIAQYARSPDIGARAVIFIDGFRPDGSSISKEENDFYIANNVSIIEQGPRPYSYTQQQIKDNVANFDYGDTAYNQSLNELESLLDFTDAHNITVVAYLPPYPHFVYQLMMSSGNYEYVRKLNETLAPIFAAHNAHLADFSDITWVANASDCNMLNGLHSGEKGDALLLLQYAKQDSFVANIVGEQRINALLPLSNNCLTLFDN